MAELLSSHKVFSRFAEDSYCYRLCAFAIIVLHSDNENG